MDDEIQQISIGDKVRSYDFAGVDDHYVEGAVREIRRIEGCDRYIIEVERSVERDREISFRKPWFVFPPVNGTPSMFGRICNNVKKLEN